MQDFPPRICFIKNLTRHGAFAKRDREYEERFSAWAAH